MNPPILDWEFPLSRPHEGIALGNGSQGVLVWGDEFLCLTVAKAGFWDHRGGTPFTLNATFPKVRQALEANDEAAIKAMFSSPQRAADTPDFPQQIGGARLELRLEGNFFPAQGALELATGILTVHLENAGGEKRELRLFQSMDADVLVIEGADDAQIRLRPSWEWLGSQLEKWGVEPPLELQIEDGGGMVQTLPEDDALALVWRKRGGELLVSTALGEPEDAAKRAVSLARTRPELDSTFFWKRYWRDVPRLDLPDEKLMRFWHIALWKQAGMTTPHAVAATLQGPWMEEYQLPAWSNDYHFNINVQLIYYPALMTNRLEHFEPLWKMVLDWMPQMRENGVRFFENKNALMLPHAVDDRCQVVGTFWTGTIDHACTAWVAQMAWLHYRYGLDERILREVAWPLLNGAFEGFWAMSEKRDGKLSLPVSVSPEYRGAQMDAWGRDASFQLAAWHMVAQILPRAALALGEKLDERWAQVEEHLPPYTLKNGRIALWEGLELEESHRHHAHLGAIWPFCSIDPFDAQHAEIVSRSLNFWNERGAGLWTGWCLPLASAICSRVGYVDAAVAWLHWMLLGWTNAGDGTRHNANFPGIAAWADWRNVGKNQPSPEIMQMDATLGFLIGIAEVLVQNRGEIVHVLPAIPERWRHFSFDNVRVEGAFLVGATVARSQIQQVRIKSERGGVLRLKIGDSELIEREMKSGEEWVWQK